MNQRLRFHIAFWLVYILFESYLQYAWIGSEYAHLSDLNRWLVCLQGEAILCIIKIPLCYALLFLPRFTIRGISRVLVVAAGTTLLFLAAITLYHLLNNQFILPVIYGTPAAKPFPDTIASFISVFPDLLFIVVMVVALKQYRLHQASQEKERTLVKEKLETELKFLRTQTNPHFLFNTLNNIYALARKKSDHTADVVMKLSKLLRFMLYESGNATITIAEELKVLDDYIELEKIRYNERLTLRFTKSVDDERQTIAPLILLPFVDNAFKHGASETRFGSYIYISVTLEKGMLLFTVENSKEDSESPANGSNIGLQNVRRQLELLYPDHDLQISNEKNRFLIRLRINLLRHEITVKPGNRV